jgi:hypothetical protein
MNLYQKQFTDPSLTSVELLAWTDPGIAIRAERVAALGQWLDLIKNGRSESAKYSRAALKSEIERVNARSALAKPLEQARDEARAAYALELEACTGATRWIEAATSDDERDLAELALKKAERAAGIAAEALRAALQAQPPPPDGAGGPDLSSTAMYQAHHDTKRLAELAPKLASYAHASRGNQAVDAAVAQGRAASTAALWAVAEHDYKSDDAAQQLFDLRWSIACGVLGIECNRSALKLPQPSSAA